MYAGFAIPANADEPGFVAEWAVKPDFAGKKKLRKSISGAACAPVVPPACLVALDEKQRTQFFTIRNKTLVPGDVMRLLPKRINGEKTGEIDAEGAAFGDGYFYLTGSHGVSRKKGAFDPSSYYLFRFPSDPDTGYPAFAFSKKRTAEEIQRTDALRAILKDAPEPIGQYAEQPLGEEAGGVNIEGLAYRDSLIFAGLRGPSVDGKAYILSADAERLFSGSAPDVDYMEVSLGEGIGIRDLAAVSDGLIVLAGPVQSKGDYSIYHLKLADGALIKLADLEMPEKGQKAETVLVLKEAADTFNVLVMYDGAADGGPREYLLARTSGR
jgi:hypothetical protein